MRKPDISPEQARRRQSCHLLSCEAGGRDRCFRAGEDRGHHNAGVERLTEEDVRFLRSPAWRRIRCRIFARLAQRSRGPIRNEVMVEPGGNPFIAPVRLGRARHSGPFKPSLAFDEQGGGRAMVFFGGMYRTSDPGPFPFAFTLGCLEVAPPERGHSS